MQLTLRQSGDVRIVRVKEAKLTYPALSFFFAAVREIVEAGARRLVIDLRAVIYIDCSAIGCLMDIHRLLTCRDGAVRLSGLQPRVETMLFMTGVHKIVDVHRDEAEALAAFGRPPKLTSGAIQSQDPLVAPRAPAAGCGARAAQSGASTPPSLHTRPPSRIM